MSSKYDNSKNNEDFVVSLKKSLANWGLPESHLQNVSKILDLLLYPYYEGSERILKLSKIDIFFYSYPFRIFYSIAVFIYIIFAEQPFHVKIPLGFSIIGCIWQGLGGACTLAVAAWIAYNLLFATIN